MEKFQANEVDLGVALKACDIEVGGNPVGAGHPGANA
jgi:hypothetical protein